MRGLVILGVIGCGSSARPSAPTPPPTPAPVTHACALHGAGTPGPDGAAWQVDLGTGTGELVLGTTGELIVAALQGGKSVSIDAATGAVCAELVAPPRSGVVSSIDPYSARSGVAHGLLVGPMKHTIAAVDLWTGIERWHRELTRGDDEYALRDALQVAATRDAIVVGYRERERDGDSYRHRELIAALDPATGRDRWRTTIVEHPRGEGIQMEGTVRVAADDTRVLARTPGKLVAFDAAAGAVIWTHTWTAAVFAPGPMTPAKRAPLVASNGTLVALAFPGVVTLLDARTGAKVVEHAVRGAATDLVATQDGFAVALEERPGAASIAAMDKQTVRWTRAAAYSVQRIRVDGDLVYALDGNGRIWRYALADGMPRLGYATQTFDFGVAGGRVVVPAGPLVAYDTPHDAPPPLAPFMRWELEPATCRPRALAWIDGDDRVAWERELPPRMRALGFGPCKELEAMYYQRRPRANAGALYSVLGVVETETALVEADATGILALRKTDGGVLADLDAPLDDRALFFDDGEFELQGLADCRGRSSRARVFARCGGKLVYFNGRTAFVVALDTLRVEARGRYDGTSTAVHGGRAERSEATITVGGYKLVLRGITYMR